MSEPTTLTQAPRRPVPSVRRPGHGTTGLRQVVVGQGGGRLAERGRLTGELLGSAPLGQGIAIPGRRLAAQDAVPWAGCGEARGGRDACGACADCGARDAVPLADCGEARGACADCAGVRGARARPGRPSIR